jgi:hypothetical protein
MVAHVTIFREDHSRPPRIVSARANRLPPSNSAGCRNDIAGSPPIPQVAD